MQNGGNRLSGIIGYLKKRIDDYNRKIFRFDLKKQAIRG